MTMFARTFRQVAQDLSREVGDLQVLGTVHSAFGSVMHSRDLIFRNANQAEGSELYIHTGAGLGQGREILTFSAVPSPGLFQSLAAVIPIPSFSPAPSINSEFEVHRLFKGGEYRQAIQEVIRGAAKTVLLPYTFAIVLGSRFRNGMFPQWTSGVTSAPDEWTLTQGTIRRVASMIWAGAFAAEVTSQSGQTVRFTQQLDNFSDFDPTSDTVSVTFKVHWVGSGNVVRAFVFDGTTRQYSTYHGGNGTEDLEVDSADLVDTLSELTGGIEIADSSGNVVTVLKPLLTYGQTLHTYALPTDLVWLHEIRREGPQQQVFNEYVSRASGDDDSEANYRVYGGYDPPRLEIKKDTGLIVTGRLLEIRGQRHAQVPSAEGDVLEINDAYVIEKAITRLLRRQAWPAEADEQGFRSRYDRALRESTKLETGFRAYAFAGSIRVKTQ